MTLRGKVKAAGGKWMPEEQLWFVRYNTIAGGPLEVVCSITSLDREENEWKSLTIIGSFKTLFYNSEGVRLYNRTLSNQLSSYTFENNYIELHKLIGLHAQLDTQLKLGDSINREPRYLFLAEVTRLLHNFLASAKSLVPRNISTFVFT